MKLLGFWIFVYLTSSCSISQTHMSKKKIKIEDMTIYMYKHYDFHYLKIVDKSNSFYFIYPVGEEKLQFTSGTGPIYRAKKHEIKSNKNLYIITSNKKDSVCFLNYCYEKNGSLIDFGVEDKNLIQKVDSFCRANYQFYKIDIKEFKKWYSPYE